MVTDPVGDFLTQIKNAAYRKVVEVCVPYSKMKDSIAQVLKGEGYLADVVKEDNRLRVVLTFRRRRAIISDIKNVSRPGLRIYRPTKRLPSPLGGAGISIISTSKGVMSNREAKRLGLGGEVLGEVW